MVKILRKITAGNIKHTNSVFAVKPTVLRQRPKAVSNDNYHVKDLRSNPPQTKVHLSNDNSTEKDAKSAPLQTATAVDVARREEVKSTITYKAAEQDAEGVYEVGYCKPPVQTRFKKGISGNPKGRHKGSKNISTLLENAGQKLVTISDDGRARKITMQDLIVRGLVTKAAKGDTRAVQNYLKLYWP
jgi:hypothetical protein